MRKLFRKHSFYFVFRLFAIPFFLISSIALMLFVKNLKEFHLSTKIHSGNKELQLFHDFDKDGFSEVVHVYRDSIRNTGYHIYVNIHNGLNINEWRIPGMVNIEPASHTQWINFGDINNDNYDDIIVFFQEHDSLFLSVIDVKNSEHNNGKFIIKKSFLLNRQHSKSDSAKIWDIYFNHHALVDLNGDGKNALIFTLVSGYSHHPRGIYLYDFGQKKIIYSYETNASLMDMDFFDLNGDNKKEIIVSTYAGGNFPPKAYQSDFYSWVFAFDPTLKPLFKPIRIYGYTSSFSGIGIRENKNGYILGVSSGEGKSNRPSRLLKINSKGEILKSLAINAPYKWKWCGKLFRIQSDSVLIYLENGNTPSVIRRYNKNFELVKEMKFPTPITLHTITDLDNDGQDEIVATRPFKLLVLDKNLNILAQISTEIGVNSPTVSIGENGEGHNKSIMISYGKFHTVYDYIRIPLLYNKKFYLALSLWIILVLFLLLIDFKGMNFAIRWNVISAIQKANYNGLLVIDAKGKIMSYSPVFLTTLHINEVFKKNYHFHKAFEAFPEIVHIIDQVMKEKKEKLRFPVSINGTLKNISVIPIHSWLGCITGYFIELTGRESSDERTKIWTNTIKKMAHDIKTPLSNIELGVRTVKDSLLQSTCNSKNILVEDLDILSHEVRRISNVMRNFLKFVNLEKPHFHLSDIHRCIQKSIANFEAYWKSNFTIEYDFDENIPMFYFDIQQMEIVCNNLIKNALDALHNEGKIIIRTSLIKDEISTSEPRHFCEIEVIDNGPGIEKEKQSLIFEANFTNKEDGNGIGLTIVKKIIEDHGGEIKVFSTIGLGTTFRILLPLKQDRKEIN